MSTRVRLLGLFMSLLALVALGAGAPLRAEDAAAAWQVSKTSGEVWVATAGVQPASLSDQSALKPGDQVRTGRNGRVLLVRGQETILIAPNSAITLPETQKDAGSTTILQQAGSIKLEVDKRSERNFEVETPYLVAAVKGTQFTVTVSQGSAKVDVSHGSVEVADFKSGQIALVMPGQSAKVTSFGPGGLSLTGAGTLNPIRKGEPRTPSLQPMTVPKGGFSAPQGQHVRALGNPAGGQTQAPSVNMRSGGLHIGTALGEVKLDIHRVTNGLARDNAGAGHSRGNAKVTVWSNGDLLPGNGVAKTYNQGNNGSGNGASGTGGGGGGGGAGGSAAGSASSGAGGGASGGGSVSTDVGGVVAGVGGSVGGVVGGVGGTVGGVVGGTCNCAGNNGKHLGQLKH